MKELRAIALPNIIVSTGVEGGPYTIKVGTQETILLSSDDARRAHATHPLRLVRILSDTSAEYVHVTPLDGPFPLEPLFPPFTITKV